jgi:transposase InsO family protein
MTKAEQTRRSGTRPTVRPACATGRTPRIGLRVRPRRRSSARSSTSVSAITSVRASTAIRFIDEVRRRLPFRVQVVQTDNGAECQSRFHWHLEELDIRHVYIRPRTPHLNGKVERSHRVDDQEFYQLLDKDGVTDDIHLFNEKLREWEDYYNYHRPHGALDGQTPYERLVAKTRAEVLPMCSE